MEIWKYVKNSMPLKFSEIGGKLTGNLKINQTKLGQECFHKHILHNKG